MFRNWCSGFRVKVIGYCRKVGNPDFKISQDGPSSLIDKTRTSNFSQMAFRVQVFEQTKIMCFVLSQVSSNFILWWENEMRDSKYYQYI